VDTESLPRLNLPTEEIDSLTFIVRANRSFFQ
jgi:hypothetical protein